jgi:hypothetical protein
MKSKKRILLAAEEHLVFHYAAGDVIAARNALHAVLPDCLLVELLDSKIGRTHAADQTRRSEAWNHWR